MTTKNANGLASAVSSSKCAYIAGCVVVVYHVDSYVQSHLVVSHRMPKSLCCVAVSHDASLVAAGEVLIHPHIYIYIYLFSLKLFGNYILKFSYPGSDG